MLKIGQKVFIRKKSWESNSNKKQKDSPTCIIVEIPYEKQEVYNLEAFDGKYKGENLGDYSINEINVIE